MYVQSLVTSRCEYQLDIHMYIKIYGNIIYVLSFNSTLSPWKLFKQIWTYDICGSVEFCLGILSQIFTWPIKVLIKSQGNSWQQGTNFLLLQSKFFLTRKVFLSLIHFLSLGVENPLKQILYYILGQSRKNFVRENKTNG